jgi:RNA polymerase sigma factor (sigma-70 family)
MQQAACEPADIPEPRPATPEAFAARYADRVRRFAVMVSPPGTDPEDLAQDALVRALQRLDRFDPARGSMDGWLWRIVVNLSRDAGRVASRTALRLERLAARAETGREPSAEDLAIRRIGDRELLAAVRRLPRRHRSVVALRFGAGLTFPEIAEALGVSRPAAVQVTRRALDRLRRDLRESHVEED